MVAAPLAGWIMEKWLSNFTYRIHMGINIFLVAIAITLLIALISTGFKTLKAALMNPVISLKSE